MIRKYLENIYLIKKITRTPLYSRIRQRLPQPPSQFKDDRMSMPEAQKVLIDWPENVKKPVIGVIKDYDPYPRWTKCCRFLENNSFTYGFYDLQESNWMEKADQFDILIGILSSDFVHLQDMRIKYFILERILGKTCFPSFDHIFLYENKMLEYYTGKAYGFPFPPTKLFFDKSEALAAIEKEKYPLISKIDPSSGSMGVEWISNKKNAASIVKRSFSKKGRATHSLVFRQKDSVFFQEFIPNDGYDIRIITVGNMVFGYYRKVLKGDFRASGMDFVEKRELPEEAMNLARKIYKTIQSPLLIVDMVHGLNGNYYVIEISPMCQMKLPEQLHVNGIPGVYIAGENGSYVFHSGKYWVYELAIKVFLEDKYLSKNKQSKPFN